MPTLVSFKNQVIRPGAVNPPYATTTYSNSGKNVGLINAGPIIDSLAFNDLPAGRSFTGQFAQLSAARTGTGVQFACDLAYNGVQFAVIYKDRTSTLFTCTTGTYNQTLVNNDYGTVTPNLRRLVNLGYA